MSSATCKDPDYVGMAEGYAKDVISGKIPACKWVKLACERHFRDLDRSKSGDFAYKFDSELARKACKFVGLMPHVKGDWAFFDRKLNKWNPIKMEPWQCFVIGSVFGWIKKSTGKRRFRKARIFVPRKNAKTALMAAIGLYMLLYDNENGAEIYCGATSKKQAMEVFKTSRLMLLKLPKLVAKKGITINVESIVLPDGSKFEPVIGKPVDGSSPHCAITDEYHEHNTSDALDSLETGMGARSQPISFVISTAGANPSGPCRQEWKRCERILENLGGFEDESCFAIIYTIDKDDKWEDLSSVVKANPNYGVSIYEEGLAAELNEARNTPKEQTKYKTKKLNEWVSARDAYYNISKWNNLERPIHREDFKDFPCYLAADFASHLDLTAVMQLFCLPDDEFALFGKYYLPNETIQKPEKQHYRNWSIEGHIEKTGDSVMDFETVREDVLKMFEDYKVIELVVDPTRMWGELPKYEAEGITVVSYRQNILTMSQPMKDLEALIESGKIQHDGCPVLSWCISNVTGAPDKKDNVYPTKEDADSKIDAAIGTLFAIGRAATRDPEPSGPLISFF